jgi:fibronectin type 3 domain-containing protein
MKKISQIEKLLLFTALFAATAWGQFTSGNLVVLRVGDGSAALTSASTAIFLDEYTPAGGTVGSTAMPTAATGSNAPIANSGSATSEGNMTRSANGRYLILGAYGAVPGVASIASTTSAAYNRVVARVDATGSADVTTKLSDAYSANNIRGACSVDGTAFWTSGNPGIRYTALGGTSSVSLVATNCRGAGIFGGQLYLSTGSGTTGVYSVGSGIPIVSGQTNTLLVTATSPYGFSVNSDGNIIYVADDGAVGAGGGIRKLTYSAGTWSQAYILLNDGSTTTAVRGLTVDWSGAYPIIYATTTETNTNKLIKVTDAGSSSTATTLATAGTNTVFRGVAFAPYATIMVTNGSSYTAPSGTPNTNDNPIGRFQLAGNINGGKLNAVTVKIAGTRNGITALKLYSSTSASFSVGSSTFLATTTDGATATFTISGGHSIPTTGEYFYVTADLDNSAAGSVTVSIDDQSKLSFSNAAIYTSFSNASLSSGNVTIVPKGLTSPSAPIGLVVTDSSNATVTIRWNKNVETDFLKYMIYRSTSANPTTAVDSTSGGLSDTTKIFTGLVNGTRYYFRVTALDSSRNESAYSNEVSTVPADRIAPTVPVGLAVSDSSIGRIEIRWRKNSESDFLRYRVYCGTSPTPTIKIDSTTNGIADTSKTFTGLTNGTRYYLRVTAVDSAGNESGYSNEVNASPNDRVAPAAPAGLAITDSSSGKIVIHWRKNSESDFLRYRVYCGTSAQPTTKVDSTTNGIADTSKTFTGLTNGTRYYLRVAAVDSAGNESGYSNEVNAAPGLVVGVQQGEGQTPKIFSLSHNYPNPFNPSTVLRFSVAQTHHATLKVYDILGNMVVVLFEGIAEEGRMIAVQFNADALPAGVYYARLQSGSETTIQRMVLMK